MTLRRMRSAPIVLLVVMLIMAACGTQAPTTSRPTRQPTLLATPESAADGQDNFDRASTAVAEAGATATARANGLSSASDTDASESATTDNEPAILVTRENQDEQFFFNFPDGFEVESGDAEDVFRLSRSTQIIDVIGHDTLFEALDGQSFNSNAQALQLYLEAAGYNVGEQAQEEAGLASYRVSLDEPERLGIATLVDLGGGLRGVVVALGTRLSTIPRLEHDSIAESMNYLTQEEQVAFGPHKISLETVENVLAFDTPEGFESEETDAADVYSLMRSTQIIEIIGHNSLLVALSEATFHSEADALRLYLESAGYIVGEAVQSETGIITYHVTSEEPERLGIATLVDLGDGLRAIIIALGTRESMIPRPDGEAVIETLRYSSPDEQTASAAPLMDVLSERDGLSTFFSAMEQSNLSEILQEGDHTILAPTDTAFAATLDELELTAEELLNDSELLETILNNHIVKGALVYADVAALDGQTVETLGGEILTITINEDESITLNDETQVIEVDIVASNGVIHVLDDVLLPVDLHDLQDDMEAAEAETPTPEPVVINLVEAIITNSDLSTLAAALIRTELIATLDGEEAYTLFAPDNLAFDTKLRELGLTFDDLIADTGQLSQILTYHVIEGALFADDLQDGEIETLNGSTLTIQVTDDGTVLVNDVAVKTANIETTNGVIHIIDSVLLPSE